MRLTITIFCMLVANWALADYGQKVLNGFDPSTDYIADNYEAGPYLIYDCTEKHWTCVMESFHQDCEKIRLLDLGQNKRHRRCIPFGAMPNKKSCFQKQLFLTSQNHGDRFCIGKNWKEKDIKY